MKQNKRYSGFSLLQLSVIIAAAGMIAAASLPTQQGDDVNAKYIETKRRMVAIEEATNKMMASWGRRPCPASGTYALGTANFGTEDGSTRGDCITRNSATGVIAPFNDANVVAGTVPVRKLQLPDEYAFDAWGRPFTYVVDKRATEKASCVDKTFTRGAVTVNNMGTTESVMTALISHGPDGHGAFPPQGAARTSRFNAGSTDTDQARNAGGSNFAATPYTNNFIKKERTATFDDLLWYGDRYKNTCCLGKVCKDVVSGSDTEGDAVVIVGDQLNENLGSKVIAGDFNNDGKEDYIFGSDPSHSTEGKKIFVLYGSSNVFPAVITKSMFQGTAGSVNNLGFVFTTTGTIKDYALGDVNGDGTKDLVVVGNRWLAAVFGKNSDAFGSTYAISSSIASADGFYITQGLADDARGDIGKSIAIGDINNDGYDDILVGQYDIDDSISLTESKASGSVYLLLGRATGSWTSPYTSMSSLIDGVTGFRFDGWGYMAGRGATDPAVAFGYNLHTLDFDGDGLSDMVITSAADTSCQSGNCGALSFDVLSNMLILYGKSGAGLSAWNAGGTGINQLSAQNSTNTGTEMYWMQAAMAPLEYGGVTPREMVMGTSVISGQLDIAVDSIEDIMFKVSVSNATYTLTGSATRRYGDREDIGYEMSGLGKYTKGAEAFYTIEDQGALPTTLGVIKKLEIGDMNGDGADDFMMSASASNNAMIRIFFQQNDDCEIPTMPGYFLTDNDFCQGAAPDIVFETNTNLGFGNQLSYAADFKGIGQDALAVAEPDQDVSSISAAGKIYIMYNWTDLPSTNNFDSDVPPGTAPVMGSAINPTEPY